MNNFVTKGQMFEYKRTYGFLIREVMNDLGKKGWECISSYTDGRDLVLLWKREYYDFGIDGVVEYINKKD